jgi:hypothetical protein
LLDGHVSGVTSNGGGSGSANLLDMNFGGHTSTSTPASVHHNDFLGMTAAPSPPVSGNYNPFGTNNNMQQPPPPQQQQQQQRPGQQPPQNRTTFDSFNSNPNDAFGGLGTPWK